MPQRDGTYKVRESRQSNVSRCLAVCAVALAAATAAAAAICEREQCVANGDVYCVCFEPRSIYTCIDIYACVLA